MEKRWIRLTGNERHRFESFSQLRLAAFSESREAYTVSLAGRDEVLLALRASGEFGRTPPVRLTARDARRLAADLLACAGAIDGSSGD
jgi:hypothetical protein